MITRKLIAATANRMIESERQAVRSAIRKGSKVVSCGRYYIGGPLVLIVTKPADWNSEVWANAKTVCCNIPADKEAATLAWAARSENQVAAK